EVLSARSKKRYLARGRGRDFRFLSPRTFQDPRFSSINFGWAWPAKAVRARALRRHALIEVQDLSKSFGPVTAVYHVSFTVKKGEILGFLGPNGAGKTTTMRILTGYLPATSGTARVAGYDVFEDSMEVRRRIGYLPEVPPLYPDMTVGTYLDFVARIKNVPAEKRNARIDEAMTMTSITDKRDELIKRLSRGYKQRVGLAQALVHDPDVIILDEPTVGLDPKQIIEVRH